MITIDNSSLEAQLISQAKEFHIKVDELIEKLLSQTIVNDEMILDSHKKELDSRFEKYRNRDKTQLMDLDQLKHNIAQKI